MLREIFQTLNLTGPIILGLSIATASLLYAYYKAYPNKGYRRYRRSVREEDQDGLLNSLEQLQSLEESLNIIGIRSRQCQLQAVCRVMQGSYSPPAVDTVTEVVKLLVYRLRKVDIELLEELLGLWLAAAEEGERGDDCEERYQECDHRELGRKLSLQVVEREL